MKKINLKTIQRKLSKCYEIAKTCNYKSASQTILEVSMTLGIYNGECSDVGPAADDYIVTKNDFFDLAEEIKNAMFYENDYNPYFERKLEKAADYIENKVKKAGD